MKVMTFNLRCDNLRDIKNKWYKRKRLVKQLIDESDCDIVGVQECTDSMFKDLKIMFPQYNIVGEPRTRIFFKERTCILIKKNIEYENATTFWLSDTPQRQSSKIFLSMFPRICTSVTIKNHLNEKIIVCNTHLDCGISSVREKQVDILFNNINKMDCNSPLILMGDFNALPYSRVVNKIRNDFNLISAADTKKELYDEATRTGFGNNEKGVFIDYVFVSKKFIIKNVSLNKYCDNGRYPSDHYPVYCEIE